MVLAAYVVVKRLYHAIVLLYGNSLFICSYVIWKINCMEYENLSLRSKSKRSQNRSHASRPWCWFLMLLVTLIYWKYISDGRWNSNWKWQSCKGPQMLFRRQNDGRNMQNTLCKQRKKFLLCKSCRYANKENNSENNESFERKNVTKLLSWQKFLKVCHQLKSSSANNMKIEWRLISR